MSWSLKEQQEYVDKLCEQARLRRQGLLDAKQQENEQNAGAEASPPAECQALPAVEEGKVKVEEETDIKPVVTEPNASDETRKAPLEVKNENEKTSEEIKDDKSGNMEADAPEPAKLCKGTKKNGEPCTVQALEDGFCFAHSPLLEEKRSEARERGGFNSSKAARLEKVISSRFTPVSAMLESALQDLNSKKIDPRTAQAIASLSRALVSVLNAGEMEERLRMLEDSRKGGQDVAAE